MNRVTIKTMKSLNGYQVEFTIGVQTFSLQELENVTGENAEGKAIWYKKQLEYAFSKLIDEDWKIESVDRYFYGSGRNHWTYKETTYWYESHTMERKESVRQETIVTGGEWNLPEWAKGITSRRKSLESAF